MQVEYKEYFTSQIFHAVAEVPKEALPEKCRPGFETAWLTKMKFKVKALVCVLKQMPFSKVSRKHP